ncbi:hypothetical protein GCM10020001_097110 [Nonomuraea salmonea]
MRARPIDEPHRVASPLELLFDLTFVVAVAAVTAQFAHAIVEGHAAGGIAPFLQVFFAIWWAWMNFTWFASSYDTDDVGYRVLTMVQMAGVLVLAAGVPVAAEHADYGFVTLGYVIMRIGLVLLWLRAASGDPARRRTALRYAAGISVVTVGWLYHSVLAPVSAELPLFVVLALLELAVPLWAERERPTTWHPHHIAERYGLFTIILLGESVLAVSRGVAAAMEAGEVGGRFVVVAVSGLVVLFALWWLYFLVEAGEGLSGRRDRSYLWGGTGITASSRRWPRWAPGWRRRPRRAGMASPGRSLWGTPWRFRWGGVPAAARGGVQTDRGAACGAFPGVVGLRRRGRGAAGGLTLDRRARGGRGDRGELRAPGHCHDRHDGLCRREGSR